MIRIARGDIDQSRLFAEDGRGDKLFRRAVDDPVAFAIFRVIAGHTLIAGQYHLFFAGQAPNDRRTVTAGAILTACFPDCVAVNPVERDKI